MDNILIFIIVVLIVLALALWAVSMIPIPMDPIIRWVISFLCVCVAGFAIARKARWL
jgi:NADH:ubiquinone oxidoreductase subunit 3 (subunit A)